MIADYFQVPFPKYSRMPIRCAAVVHTHLAYSPRFHRPVFVCRDGRDLVVSSFFYAIRAIKEGVSRWSKRYPSLRGAVGSDEDCRARLAQFIGEWAQRPVGCPIGWPEYTSCWMGGDGEKLTTKYEDMRLDCQGELRRVLKWISGAEPDSERMQRTIEKFSFENQTGRKPGQSDPESKKRKGIVGDWQNYFTREAARIFDQRCGEALVACGYETDRSWIDNEELLQNGSC